MKKDECAVIINADDFGQTESCTRAIYEAFQKGLITDTTMVANGEAMELAFAMAPEMRGHIGAHLNLTEGPALTPAMRKNAKFVSMGGLPIISRPARTTSAAFPRRISRTSTKN